MKIFENFDTGKISWFRCGGKAKIFAIVGNQNELLEVLDKYKNEYSQSQNNIICVGAGSNILFQNDYNGLVLKLSGKFNNVNINSQQNNQIIAGCGCLAKTLSQFAIKNNLIGAEFLDTIPGSVGGLVKMNAGCFGKETKDIFKSADVLIDGTLQKLSKQEMDFSYRHSILTNSDIVLSATFELIKATKEQIEESKKTIQEMQEKRKQNQILGATCGSTFANVEITNDKLKDVAIKLGLPEDAKVINSWRLIDAVGLRGYKIGGAMLSDKHCNFLLNTGKATANDIIALIEEAKKRVKEQLEIDLRVEVKIV